MELINFLKSHKIEFQPRESVRRLSFVGIGGIASLAVYPKSRGEMLCLLSYLYANAIPYKVVGNMSNILPPDGFWGVCLVCTAKMRSVTIENGIAVAECGVPLSLLCRAMASAGIMAMAELVGIPGSVGGAVYQNAGAFGLDIAGRLAFADVFDPRSDRVRRLQGKDLCFSYRASALADLGILLSAGFYGSKASREESESAMREYAHRRKEHQPRGRSLGSVFLRVGDTSAAYYIDCAGLKGHRIGGAAVSRVHAGFIVNEGNATAKEYRALVEFIKQSVFEKFCVRLKTEIEIVEEREENPWLHSI